jgi:hypothetical protein
MHGLAALVLANFPLLKKTTGYKNSATCLENLNFLDHGCCRQRVELRYLVHETF